MWWKLLQDPTENGHLLCRTVTYQDRDGGRTKIQMRLPLPLLERNEDGSRHLLPSNHDGS